MKSVSLALCFLLTGCSGGGSSVAGVWRIEQDGTGFGEGAEKTELKLGDDGKFDISIGPMSLASGTWTFTDNKLTLSGGGGKMGTDYRLDGGKLLPVVDGKDVTFWRFVRK